MKKLILACVLIICTLSLSAEKHIVESTSLAGIWRQSGMMQSDRQIRPVTTGHYKVMNPDGTFYSFITWGEQSAKARAGQPTTDLGMYGKYKITSDSTYSVEITKHFINSTMTGYKAVSRYKLLDANTLVIKYQLNGLWISEVWSRVVKPALTIQKENNL